MTLAVAIRARTDISLSESSFSNTNATGTEDEGDMVFGGKGMTVLVEISSVLVIDAAP